jgi:hypothetical protein
MSCKIVNDPSLDKTCLPRQIELRTFVGILINESIYWVELLE